MKKGKLLTLVKMAYCVPLTLAALLIMFPLLQIIAAIVTGDKVFPVELIIAALVLLYVPFGYLSCTRLLKDRELLVSGIAMNTFFIISAFYINETGYILASVFFTILWLILYISRTKHEGGWQSAIR